MPASADPFSARAQAVAAPPAHPVLPPEAIRALRARFLALDYTVAGVRTLLGPRAYAALARNETTPGLRPAEDGGDLGTLVALWQLQVPQEAQRVRAALPDLIEPLVTAGFLHESAGQVVAAADIRPYGDEDNDWWVAADLTPGMDGRLAPVRTDHVLGVNSAATTLAQITPRPQVRRALDIGTGCGIEGLHLRQHVQSVVATDLSTRALAFARITADLNGIELDLRQGSLLDPVLGEQFDLIVSNPPFVVSPGNGHVYRDSGMPGDEVSRRVVVDGAVHLAVGGYLQVLANWVHVQGESWQDRVRGWVEATGCDAWVLQREVQDPAQYVELWLRDSGEVGAADYPQQYAAWADWFAEQRVEGIGFGWVTLRRPPAGGTPVVRVEDWPHAVQMPLCDTIEQYFQALERLRGTEDHRLLELSLQVAPDVALEQVGAPGAEDPEHVVLRQQVGLRRARTVSTEQAGFVGACDGTIEVDAIVRALASILDDDVAELRDDLLPFVRELLVEGFLLFE